MPIWILSSNIIKIMSIFRSSPLCLVPPQLHERVGKWTHEPQSNFNHNKHLSNAFSFTFIFSIILFWKYKNIFTFLHTQPKPKNNIMASYLFYCIVIYFTVLHIIFNFTYIHTLLDNHSMELGTQDKEVLLQVAWRRRIRAFATVPREFDIKPRVPSWRIFTLDTTLCTWSPDELAPLLSVITWLGKRLL
jgi:hypothetical protein